MSCRNGMAAIELRDVCASYRGAIAALEKITLSIRSAEICVVLGPNGAGKSTLVKLLCGALRPQSGSIHLLGDDLATLDRRAIARRVAVVPQSLDVALGFTVREVVMMGRAPHQGSWMRSSAQDAEAVEHAMFVCELADLADRAVSELSGGEQQRVAIARALAQKTPILLLDEAGAHLDVRHLVAMHELVGREVAERRLACVAVLHDLNAAAQYADRVVLLKQGRVVAHGSVEQVMTYRRLRQVFETELYVGVNELDGARYFLPVRPRSRPISTSDL